MLKGRDLLKSLRSGGEVSRKRIYHDTPWPELAQRMPPEQHKRVADALSVDMAAIRALAIVETRDRPFVDGVPIVRFEAHHWRKRRQATKSAMAFDRKSNWRDLTRRWEMFEAMARMQLGPAIKAHSFGAYQIMGFNHYHCGFEYPQAFLDAMRTVDGQATALIRFIEKSPSLHRALEQKDPHGVGKQFNGPRYRDNNYHAKWAAALEVSHAV